MTVILLLLQWFLNVCWAETSYDELYGPDGNPRPAYAPIMERISEISDSERKKFAKKSIEAFSGDNRLSPVPRLFTQDEIQTLVDGVDQRARGLRAFLQDHYGKRSYLRQGSPLIPEKVLSGILRRSLEDRYQEVNPEMIAFLYGPDIIRDRKGNWRVIEDNLGFVGGIGDLRVARETMENHFPEYLKALNVINDPENFYRSLAEHYKAEAKRNGGLAVHYAVPPYADAEDSRWREILQDYGIVTVTPYTKKKLVIRKGAVWLQNEAPSGLLSRKKVGYVILNTEHEWLGPSHPAVTERWLKEQIELQLNDPALDKLDPSARQRLEKVLLPHPVTRKPDLAAMEEALRKSPFRNSNSDYRRLWHRPLAEAIVKGLVPTSYSPGVDFVGDKAFYPYVENLIRFYLGEEPILRNIETKPFARLTSDGRQVLDKGLFDRVFGDLSGYVIKRTGTAPRGGDGVLVGPRATTSQVKQLRKEILERPEDFQVQRFEPLSVLGEDIVDLRLHAQVGPSSIVISRTPWVRGTRQTGDGKVNLSGKGHEYTSLVVGLPHNCQRIHELTGRGTPKRDSSDYKSLAN